MLMSAMGMCPVHKIQLLSIGTDDTNGQASCVKCRADKEPKTGRTQNVEDPGEAFFKTGQSNAKIEIVDAPVNSSTIGRAVVPVKFGGATLQEIVANAVLNLNTLPMPKDIKEFKKIQKVIKTLQTLVENQNG